MDAAVKGHRVGQSTIENAQRMCYKPRAPVYPGSCQPLLTKAYVSKLEGRTRTLSGPSPDTGPARTFAPSASTGRQETVNPGVPESIHATY